MRTNDNHFIFSFCELIQSFSIQLLKKSPMKRVEIRMMKFEAVQIHFLGDVFVANAFVIA